MLKWINIECICVFNEYGMILWKVLKVKVCLIIFYDFFKCYFFKMGVKYIIYVIVFLIKLDCFVSRI